MRERFGGLDVIKEKSKQSVTEGLKCQPVHANSDLGWLRKRKAPEYQ